MLSRALEVVEKIVVDRPRATLMIALVLTALAAWQGSTIEMRTARRELVAENDLPQQRYDAVTAELGEIQPLIVVLERTDPDVDLGAVATDLAERLRGVPAIDRVVYRLDRDWLLRVGPWLADPEQIRAAVEGAERLLGEGAGPIRIDGLADLNERIAASIERSVAEGTALPGDSGSEQADRLVRLLEAQAELLAGGEVPDPGSALLVAAAAETGVSVHDSGVYGSDDRVFLFVLGAEANAGLSAERELVRTARDALAEVARSTAGFRGGLTGRPAMTVEEMDTIGRDGRRTSAIALLGVVLLAGAAFHWRRHAVLGLIVLGAGVVWAIGGLALQIGYLNMITTAMIPILIGLGIDYAVHPLSQYELERQTASSRAQAVRRTFRKTSSAVVVSALTTAAAFACFLFMEFRGFSELGQAASVGVLLCLAAALLVLPALLAVAGRAPAREAEPPALVDRLWSDHLIDRLCRAPRTVVAVFAVLTVAAGLNGREVELRSSLLELLPPAAESLRYLEQVDESSFGTYFNIVLADDLGQLRDLEARASGHPEILRFDALHRLLPVAEEATAGANHELARLLSRVEIGVNGSPDREHLGRSLGRLEGALALAADTAFMAGLGELAGELERGRTAAETAARSVADGATPEQLARERTLLADAEALRGRLLAAIDAGPPTRDELPASLRSRYITRSGRYAGYVYASENIFEPGFLSRFNRASRAVSADAIGWPMLFEAHSNGITNGFRLALAAGAMAVLGILAFEMRRPGHVALALLPVVTGLLWMTGAMPLLGLSFNFANLVAIPLVIGVGIDAGVHVVHRYRLEGAEGVRTVMSHTGRAVLIGSLTTMVGFGSLMLAHHRGMAGLGTLLFLGVGASMLAALVVLPNLLIVLRMTDR